MIDQTVICVYRIGTERLNPRNATSIHFSSAGTSFTQASEELENIFCYDATKRAAVEATHCAVLWLNTIQVNITCR